MRFLFRSLWLAVPDFLYFALLFGSLITLIVSIGIAICVFARKKDKAKIKGCAIAILISIIFIILTMTGKIAPYCSFGG